MTERRPIDPVATRLAGRVAFRMAAPTLAVSGLLLAVGAGAAWYVHRLQQDTAELLSLDVSSVRAAEELVITLRQVGTLCNQFLISGDRANLAAARSLRPEAERWLGEVVSLSTTEFERSLALRLAESHGRFWGELARLEREGGSADASPELGRLVNEVLIAEVLAAAQEYLDANEAVVAATIARLRALPGRLTLGLLLLGVCGSVAGLLAGFGIARGVGRSIVQLSVPIRDAAGRLDEVVGPVTLAAGRDVDDLEALLRAIAERIGAVVDQLEQSRREATRAEQLAALGQLAAGMAHELRNPLSAVKVLVQSAADRGEAAGLHGRRLSVVEDEIARMERSIQSFLDFARPPEVERRAVAVREVVEQTLEVVSGRAELKGVGLRRELPDPRLVVEADAGGLRQVLLNLLLNAIDATPEGGTVSVSTACGPRRPDGPPHGPCDADGRGPASWLTLRVSDSGGGLPAAVGDRIFEPFVSTKETGLGLGLSICKRIVEAHGGEIDAAEGPGGGAVFTVRLPGARSMAGDDAATLGR